MLILCGLLSHQIVGKVCICYLFLCSIFLLPGISFIIIIIVIVTVTFVTIIIFPIVLIFYLHQQNVKYTFPPGMQYICQSLKSAFGLYLGLQVFICEPYDKRRNDFYMNSY